MKSEDAIPRVVWNLQAQVESLCADLLSDRSNEEFIWRLSGLPQGQWVSLIEPCSGLDLPSSHLETIAFIGDLIQVTHLPWPNGDSPKKDVLILFAHTPELWTYCAYYNLRVLEDRRNRPGKCP